MTSTLPGDYALPVRWISLRPGFIPLWDDDEADIEEWFVDDLDKPDELVEVLRILLGEADPAGLAEFDRLHNDGWREHPDGRPLVLRLASAADQRGRRLNELWKKCMDALGVRMRFEPGQFGELIKRSLAGQLMMWGFAWSATAPDGDFFLGLAYGPNAEQSNDARFRLAAFDRVYERQRALPDGPQRLAAMQEATRLMLAYQPYIAHHHRIVTDLAQARVLGYRRHPFTRDWWRYTDVA